MAGISFEDLAAGLREWAVNATRYEQAAVELLIWHGEWLYRASFQQACIRRYDGGEIAIRWDAAREFSDRVTAGGLGAPRASTSEAAVLDLAVALGEDRFRLSNMGTAHRQAIADAVFRALALGG